MMSVLPESTRALCRAASIGSAIFAAILGLAGIVVILSITFGNGFSLTLSEETLNVASLTSTARVLAVLYSLILLGITASVFIAIAKLFDGFRHGPVLSARLSVDVRWVGRSLIWLGIAMACSPIAQTIVSWSNGTAAFIDITPDPATILALLLGLTLTTLARVLHDAVEIELENRQFI